MKLSDLERLVQCIREKSGAKDPGIVFADYENVCGYEWNYPSLSLNNYETDEGNFQFEIHRKDYSE